MGGNLFGCPFAAAGAKQIANGGKLFFGFAGPFLLFDGFGNGFFRGFGAG